MTDGFHPCGDYRSPSALGNGRARRAISWRLYNSRTWEDERGHDQPWLVGTYRTRKAAVRVAKQNVANFPNNPDWQNWWIEEV